MKCPQCQSDMQAGWASMQGSTLGTALSFLGALAGGGGWSSGPYYLHFLPEGSLEPVRVDHSRRAFQCPSWRRFLLTGGEGKPEVPPFH